MKGLGILVCFVCMSEAILVNTNGPGGFNNSDKSDQLITQASQVKRSAGYGGYYPDLHHGYGYEHGIDYYPHHPEHHQNHHPEPHHPHHYDAFKALLVPLAGVALFGAAAIFASNPILLQLGVIQGKRRRRNVGEKQFQDLLILEKFISQLPTTEVEQQNRRMLASYLSCSGGCVQRVACEVHHQGAPEDIHVLDLVVSEILDNEFIDKQLKRSIIKATKTGRSRGSCQGYYCPDLDKLRNLDSTQKI